MIDCQRLSLANCLVLNGKQVVLVWVGGYHKERFKGNENFLGGRKEEALNRLGWRRSMLSYVSLRQLGAVLLVVAV